MIKNCRISEQQQLKAKTIYMKGGTKRPRCLVLENYYSENTENYYSDNHRN